jgi:hypothetical protein
MKTSLTPVETFSCIVMLLWIGLWLCALGGLAYVAWHFISKAW